MAVKTKLQLAEAIAKALQEFKSDAIKFGEFNDLTASILDEYKYAQAEKK